MLLYPFSLFAGVDLTTIDNFNIFSTSEHDLIVSKPGHKDRVNFLAFRMERPFCICANPVISLGSDKEMEQSKSMCESNWYYEEVEPKTKEMDV